MVDKQDFIPHRELASISATHARIDYVLNQLENLVPPEALSNPMVRMFLTFVKESKKDLRRMPEDFIISLSRPIGQAFSWVADGDNTILDSNELFAVPAESDNEENQESDESDSDDSDEEYGPGEDSEGEPYEDE